MYWRASSAMLLALWRMLAIMEPKSCTPPTKMEPAMIQSRAGAQPKNSPARMGPMTGPAPAMELK